jgi:CheY-like chemotaxis protein
MRMHLQVSPLKDLPSILIAADSELRAHCAARPLVEEFGVVRISTKPAQAVADFEACRPVVLVLAFGNIENARSYRHRLSRASQVALAMPHSAIVLCGADDLQRAYDLCKAGVFDDYVLFWPRTNDAPRLAMAVHHALHLLSTPFPNAVGARRLAAHARHIASLEPNLAELARRFSREVDMTRAAVGAVERTGGNAFRRCIHQLGESVDALCGAAQTLAVALGPQLQAARTMRELANRMRPTVLAVDDDSFEQMMLARLLKGTKIELICASTGAQAFRSMAIRRPDLVLMDIDLPDVNGMEVTRRLKSVEPLADIPVIMVTGRSRRTVVMESLSAGAADFMVKPFCRATLLDKLEAYLPGNVT